MSQNDAEHRTCDISYSEINLIEIPIRALSVTTQSVLSTLINRKHTTFMVADGDVRDYRRLLSKIGIDYFDGDLTLESVLRIWEQRPLRDANLWKFQNILGLIGRWDVVGETNDLFYNDAAKYLADQRMGNLNIYVECSRHVGIHYDAIVLCAEENFDFAKELVAKLYQHHPNFKLYIHNGNAPMDHRTLLKLCDRLIVIVSPAFLESRAYTLFQNYSHQLSYGEDKNKIIPILYQSCQLPELLRFYFVLSYIESSYTDKKDPLRDTLASFEIDEKKEKAKPAPKSRKFFITKFSMPRISNWKNWMRKWKKHKKWRVRVMDQAEIKPMAKTTNMEFNVDKLMREKMIL